jgi:hypothetical protein
MLNCVVIFVLPWSFAFGVKTKRHIEFLLSSSDFLDYIASDGGIPGSPPGSTGGGSGTSGGGSSGTSGNLIGAFRSGRVSPMEVGVVAGVTAAAGSALYLFFKLELFILSLNCLLTWESCHLGGRFYSTDYS